MNDLKFAFRQLLKNPGFTAVAVLTLALGIGANTSIFSVWNSVFLRPLAPVRPDEMVSIISNERSDATEGSSSYADYLDYREQTMEVMSAVIASGNFPSAVNFGTERGTQRAWAGFVSADYFPVLGVKPIAGRFFLPEEDKVPGRHTVALLSERFWRTQFGTDPNVVGKTIKLNRQPFTVAGVVPEKAAILMRVLQVDFFVPLVMREKLSDALTSTGNRWLTVWGRLQPGVNLGHAQAKLTLLAARLQKERPKEWVNAKGEARGIVLFPEREMRLPGFFFPRGPIVSFLTLMMSLVGLVLLIVCINLANLLLARSAGRRREVGVRLALGASRWRLIRQLIAENLLLGLMGGLAGVVLAVWTIQLITAIKPAYQFMPMIAPVVLDLTFDSRVTGFALVVSLLTVLAFGLVPAMRTSRVNLVSTLKESGHQTTERHRRFSLRNLLVAGQVALSLALLIGAGLFLRALQRVANLDLGFDPKNLALLSVQFDPSADSLKNPVEERERNYVQRVLERLQSVPGVSSVALTLFLPLDFGRAVGRTQLEGYDPKPNEEIEMQANMVGPQYFNTLRIPLISGRDFTVEDRERGAKVAIVNEALVKRYWPGQNPVGKRVSNSEGFMEVIGVVKTGKYNGFTEAPTPFYYMLLPKDQLPPLITFLVRTSPSAESMLPVLHREVQSVDHDVPVLSVKTMGQHLGLRLLPARLAATLATFYGCLALITVAVGLYGVLAYFVSQRTREIGIRMTLGARRGDLLRWVMGQGMLLAAIGLMVGLGLGLTASRLLSSFLFGVSPADPVAFLSVTSVILLVALAACWLPARRAASVDPMEALRYE